ncbi:MAG TPA: response regulator [Spirochaetota bacterium]|nr:response regulator [Spirochaetota bacterium]HPJ33299.1 response regulator [Spirochaetota bacterium]
MRNILLVEDDRITSRLIQKYILDIGYNVAGAVSSGEEASRLIETKEPDLVLMDINLEGQLDGIESAKSISSRFSLPFVYITSSSDYSTIERAKESNAYGYIIKPFDKRDLRATIEMALLRHQMELHIREDENRISTILNSIVDTVVVVDGDGLITYVNASGLRMLEKEADELLNRPIVDVIKIGSDAKEDDKTFFPMSMNYIEFNNYLTTDARQIPVDFTSTPLWMDKGKLRGAVLVIRDITQQVEYDRKIQESMETLSRAMYGIVEAITKTVETRDPYTAGHQTKVADIAKEIAKEMGLRRDVIESVNLAGQIHDLGKIAIPAEILNKPGRINEIEFALIKTHSQMGYDILKNIDFPWPIADIVLQHHEKFDGSGYPNGIRGEDILIQARIIAVADVLEAMASHRPYRAALGIDAAFEELQDKKGIHFDPEVVESCIRIFKENGFKVEF